MSDTKELAVVKKYRHENAMVLVHEEDLDTQRMFKPVITKIPVTPNDFHECPIQGKMMPKSHHVDRIGDAAGVEFVWGEVKKEGDLVWVGRAQGRRRMPDGSWRTSSVQEYEFDVETRSEEDFLNDKKNRYADELSKRKHIVELKKVARQRAATGARLRVIRELVGIPIAFSKDDFQRALVVSRVAVNTDAMLEDPQTRRAAISHAVGAADTLFGTERNVTPQREALEAPQDEAEDFDDFDDESEEVEEPPIGERKAELWRALEEYEAAYTLPPKAAAKVRAVRDDLPGADEAGMEKLKDWLDGWSKSEAGMEAMR